SAAQASCGDYLHLNANAAKGNLVASHSIPYDAPSPCTGPECSKQRGQLPLAPVVPTNSGAPKWIVLPAWLTVLAPDGARLDELPPTLGGVNRFSPPVPPPRIPLAS
ncbi:MAG TPA: hypothetical protein VGG61_12450, partial [Gemmataceae bacterium]